MGKPPKLHIGSPPSRQNCIDVCPPLDTFKISSFFYGENATASPPFSSPIAPISRCPESCRRLAILGPPFINVVDENRERVHESMFISDANRIPGVWDSGVVGKDFVLFCLSQFENMSCFPCFSSGKKKKDDDIDDEFTAPAPAAAPPQQKPAETPKPNKPEEKPTETKEPENGNITSKNFTFRELATATNNFRPENLLGEGGFGRVYKGSLDNNSQAVAVKQLDRNGLQGNKEFVVEVLMLCNLHHQNLVNLIGYCADGDQRLLVYEFMPLGSLEDHLFEIGPEKKPLDWETRMKIATGAAKGLEYLHDTANPPVIFRDLKSSNILLDEWFSPKLSDFGLAKLGPMGDKSHVSSRVMGTYGYCAPEYARTGQLTLKSDVYSFGVVLLELITGRSAIDTTRSNEEQNLVSWAQPYFKDPKRFPELADPLLNGKFPVRGLNQAVAISAMCLQEEAVVRPLIADVVTALSFLTVDQPAAGGPLPALSPPPEVKMSSDDLPRREEKHLSDGSSAGKKKKGGHHSRKKSSSSDSDDDHHGKMSSDDDNPLEKTRSRDHENSDDDQSHNGGHSDEEGESGEDILEAINSFMSE
ncbi:hypothetical protein ACLOJK_011356 [Asimina triloba]